MIMITTIQACMQPTSNSRDFFNPVALQHQRDACVAGCFLDHDDHDADDDDHDDHDYQDNSCGSFYVYVDVVSMTKMLMTSSGE